MNLPNSQSSTSKILAASFIKEDILNPTHSSAVEYQIKYTTASDTEPQEWILKYFQPDLQRIQECQI